MVYTVYSSPEDTASLFRALHNANTPAERARLTAIAEFPRGSSVSLKVPRSEVFDQDRLNLGISFAQSLDKIFGVVVNLLPASGSANTLTPACAIVMFKFCWYDDHESCNRSLFLRTSAYAASFAPRVVSPEYRNLRRGDFVCGLLHRLKPPFLETSFGN